MAIRAGDPVTRELLAWIEHVNRELSYFRNMTGSGTISVLHRDGGPVVHLAGLPTDVGGVFVIDTDLVVEGDATFEGDVTIEGSLGLNLEHVTLGSNEDDYALPDDANILVVDLSADVTISGVVPPQDGHILWLHNEHSTNRLIITNEDTGSATENRFRTPNAQTLYLTRGQGFGWAYSGEDERWFPLDERFSVDGTAVHRANFDSTDFDVTFSAGVASVATNGFTGTVPYLSDVVCSETEGITFDISEMEFENGLLKGEPTLLTTYNCECCEVEGEETEAPIATSCCPDDDVPAQLFFTPSGFSGGCTCANGASIEINFDLGENAWIGSGALGSCGSTIHVRFGCVAGAWKIAWSCTAPPTDGDYNATTTETCSPFEVTKTDSTFGGTCCMAMVSATFTISE